MPSINPNISLSAIPIETRVQAERRLLNRTMYGLNDIVRVDVEGENIVYKLNTTGETFTAAKDAFDAASKTGMTTFARITGDLETSSYNTRGFGGLEQRLKTIRDTLTTDAGLANRLGIDDPNLIRFEVATFKTGIGNKQSIKSIVDQVGENLGVIVPDDSAFNLLRVFSGDREFTVGEISRLFSATSEGLGGILSTQDLMNALKEGPDEVASMYSKSGKRVRGAIGLRDISLAGEDMGNILQQVSGTTKLDKRSVRIFKISEDLMQMAESYISTLGAMDQVIGALKSVGVLDDNGNVLKQMSGLNADDIKLLEGKFKAGFDGTSVINSRMFNAMRAQVENELNTLMTLPVDQRSQPFVASRISELKSQLDNLKGSSFQAITSRIFMKRC